MLVKKKLPVNLINLLKKIDTPTVCNSIEVAQGKRGFSNFTKRTICIANKKLPPLVGFAKTAHIRSNQPSLKSRKEVQKIRRQYYHYMSQVDAPTVCVIEDLDYPHAQGAYWGEVNTAIHRSFGIGGVLTNGVMRDLGSLATNFQVIAGSIGPSHGFVHVVDYDQPVKVFGLKVKPRQLIHADQHGAVVIPEMFIDKLLISVKKLLSAEKIILNATRNKNFSFKKFQIAWEKYEKNRV